MPTPDPFPLNIALPKEDHPALTAWLQQFGLDKYVNADELNQLFQALNYLYENLVGGGGSQNLQQVTDILLNLNGEAETTNPLKIGGLRILEKILFDHSLISALRTFQWPDKSGVVAMIEDLNAIQEGLQFKESAKLYIDVAIPMNGVIPQNTLGTTYQGVTLAANDRVVLSAQTNPIYNGIYRMYEAGGFQRFARTNDANATNELNNAIIPISDGSDSYKNKLFRQTTANPVIGTNNIVFSVFGGTVPNATNTLAGIMKLYDSLGTDTDGTINRGALTTLFGLKADKTELTSRIKVLCLVNNLATTHTGNTSSTTLYTLALPANTFAVGDRGVIDYQVSQNIVNASQFNGECYINGSPAIEICRFRTSLTTHTFIGGVLSFEVLSGNLIRIKEVASTSDYGSNAVLYSTFSFNPTVYNELLFAIKLGNSANTGKIERIKVTKESL